MQTEHYGCTYKPVKYYKYKNYCELVLINKLVNLLLDV